MPFQPGPSELHFDRPLTNISVAYLQSQDEFIADKVFPIVPVKHKSDKYNVFTKDYWFRSAAAKRAPASESVGTGYRIDNTPFYNCDVWAVHHDVPLDDYANADDGLDPDADATELVSRNLLLRRERLFMATYMSPGVWTGFQKAGSAADYQPNVDGNGYWDSPTSDPVRDISYLRSGMKKATGVPPNTLVISDNVETALENHPSVLNRIKTTTPGSAAEITREVLKGLFKVDNIFVAGAVLNSAQEGQPASMNFMSSNSFLLTYTPSAPSIRKPAAGYIFTWTGRVNAGAMGNTIEKIPMPLKKAWRIEGEMAFAMNQVGKDLGVLGTSVLQKP